MMPITKLNQDLNQAERFRIRRSPEVKQAFFDYVSAFLNPRGWQGRIEGTFGKRPANLIFGDEKTAKVILTAHYDTSLTGYTAPNFFVTNAPGIVLDAAIMLGIFGGVVPGGAAAVGYLVGKKKGAAAGVATAAGWLGLMAAYTAMSFWKDNKFNFNDNTSGCVALLAIADRIAKEAPELRDHIALVFFDKEESGLKGSKLLAKQLADALAPAQLRQKLVLNFDCVGGRDTLPRLYTHSEQGLEIARRIRKLSPRGDFKVYKSPMFPSDSSSFKKIIPAISFISVHDFLGIPGLEQLRDTHSKRDNFFNEAQVGEYVDLGVRALKEILR
jgi:hypothetical protein